MIVEILEDQPRLGIKKGQLYNAEPYWIDPPTKVALLNRISKGGRHFKKNPMCTQYRSQVKILKYGKTNASL